MINYNRKYVRCLLTFFVLVIRFVVYFISILLLVVVAIMADRGGRSSSLKIKKIPPTDSDNEALWERVA